MWFWKFSTKKGDFIKKVNFSIDNDFQYFPPENHFLYRKNDIQENLVVKKKFSQQHESVSRSTPHPHSVAEKSSKSAKILPMGTSTKTRKNTIINRETVFTKIFEKTRTYGEFDENFQTFARNLRVKAFSPVLTK